VNYGSRLVVNGEGVSYAMTLAARASTLERPPGVPGATMDAWIELLPTFAAWADGRVTEAAALLDRVSGAAPATQWHAFGRGQMNLALGRVDAAERAFQQMPDAAEREILLGYTALARGDTAGARAQFTRAVPAWAESVRTNRSGLVFMPCWALLRAGLPDGCRQAIEPWLGQGPSWDWIAGALLAEGDADADTALRALQGVVARRPPGDTGHVVAIDAIARQLERRGDIAAAVDMLRRLDGVHRAAYPRYGAHGFNWLMTRTHLLDLERQLGRTDRVAALVQELEGWVAVADPDFVVRSALR
jgi:hypothetical protein